MADNTTLNTGTGGDQIATDELATLNGAGSTLIKVQRVKPGFGADGDFRDASKLFPFPVDTDSKRTPTYFGRAGTFRIPGRAGTTGAKLFAIWNAVGSAVLVDVEKLTVDLTCTVIKAVTVLPPAIRLYRITAIPTNGTAGVKVARDTALSSNASVSLFMDASADGTLSATALAATLPASNIIDQKFASRLITAAGYEMADEYELLRETDERVTLRAGEGVVVALDYTAATQNPATDMWLVAAKWTEYTATA